MRFTESHEWILIDGDKGTVGITEYAQKELGEIVYIELPKVGQQVKMGEEVCVLESTKAAADVYAPVSGKIIAVNEGLQKKPSSINQSAQSSGWLFQIEISHPKECEHLLSASKYHSLVS
jgi:glycine cleavage system H protein